MKKFLAIRYLIILAVLIFAVGAFAFLKTDRSLPFDFIVAEKRDIIQETSVVGRVEPVKEVSLSFNVSGRVITAPFNVGDKVSQGEILMRLDDRDAQSAIRSAEINLDNAKLSLERIRRQETENAVAKQSAEAELSRLFEEAFNLFGIIYADVPNRIKNLENYFEAKFSENEGDMDYYNQVVKIFHPLHFKEGEYENSYKAVRKTVNENFDQYKTISRSSPPEFFIGFLDDSYDAIKTAADFIREARDTVSLYNQILNEQNLTPTKISVSTTESQLSELSNLSTKLDEYVLALFSIRQQIKDQREAVIDTDLDLRNQELLVRQREIELRSAFDKLSDHYIRAPFDGVITEVIGKTGEFASSNQQMVSLISGDLFELEANVPEADIARIGISHEARVTLDAFGRDKIFRARVTSIDPAGVLIDGVATYKVTFTFEEKSELIRAGMTADIDVLGQTAEGVIAVPARAVLRRDGRQFVQVLNKENEIEEVEVRTGLRGSDGFVEITSGLSGGERVVTAIR